MSQATNTKLMDTEPGGENTQYESVNTFTKPHAKAKGQFGDSNPNEADQQAAKEKKDRGEKTAENVRYGEAISEHGFGGETVGNEGGVGRGMEEGTKEQARGGAGVW
ncbi:hypothetical protein LHYA1_G008112 [Lachnellula hyalina]|uniref:Uncharacterized protein n=1 Tax=Lachnellula hyalina TaxID=1316788 RepID=A0A8H8TXE5_9HELO|nr:uncharacterized protein LHYA1_G008112 [Lachnellula hyalina]TVY22901.1 hypothetical protein LHYA1_G008112 [Lachnellula hyalina]